MIGPMPGKFEGPEQGYGKVGKGSIIRNSIVMQDNVIGDNVNLNCVITDKNVVIRDRRNLSGCETQPYCIPKGSLI